MSWWCENEIRKTKAAMRQSSGRMSRLLPLHVCVCGCVSIRKICFYTTDQLLPVIPLSQQGEIIKTTADRIRNHQNRDHLVVRLHQPRHPSPWSRPDPWLLSSDGCITTWAWLHAQKCLCGSIRDDKQSSPSTSDHSHLWTLPSSWSQLRTWEVPWLHLAWL